MNKRGISPLIATVLIVGFTIVLAVLVIAWLSGLFGTKLNTEQCTIKGQELCGQGNSLLNIDTVIDTTPDPDQYKATVSFLGSAGSEPTVKVEFIDINGVILQVDTLDLGVGNPSTATYASDTIEAKRVKVLATYAGSIIVVPGVTCSDVACAPLTKDF